MKDNESLEMLLERKTELIVGSFITVSWPLIKNPISEDTSYQFIDNAVGYETKLVPVG